MGRAYLAYCSAAERDVILTFLHASEHGAVDSGYDAHLERIIEMTRRKTYATSERRPDESSRSFAIPILSKASGAAVAAMAMSYYASSLTEAQATGRFLAEMYEIAGQIAQGLYELDPEPISPSAPRPIRDSSRKAGPAASSR